MMAQQDNFIDAHCVSSPHMLHDGINNDDNLLPFFLGLSDYPNPTHSEIQPSATNTIAVVPAPTSALHPSKQRSNFASDVREVVQRYGISTTCRGLQG